MPSVSFLRYLELKREKVADWKAYPFCIPAIEHLDRLDLSAPVTFFVGENGSGKSTLIEAIAICAGFNPEGGTRNFQSRHRPSESSLRDCIRLTRGTRREKGGFFLRAETMFNVSTEAEEYRSYGWADLHEMSHGEAFLWVAVNRFRDQGLFILDEPEAALSPQRQLSLLVRIRQLVQSGSQFVISTHSPILLAYPASTIYQLDRAGIRQTSYEETDQYAVTRAFLQDPAGRIRKLFADAEIDI